MDDERIDFGALDPSADVARWTLLADGVAARGMALLEHDRRPTLADLLAAWRRPVVVLAAALALVAIPLLLLVPAGSVEPAGPGSEATLAVVDWAWSGQPQAAELIEAIGR